MEADHGSGAGDLTHYARFAASPRTFHIFLALRILEAAFPEAPRFGESARPRQDRVRLGQEPEMGFPGPTIHEFRPPSGDRPGRVTNFAFGLFGPHGPLPAHISEYARERQINFRDPTLVAFADMLTHRLMTLFYRAWTTGQPAPDLDRGTGGRLDGTVAALAGYAGPALAGRDAMPDVARRHFAGFLAPGPRHADGLASMLQSFFRVPVRVIEFVGTWLELEPGDRWQLGAATGLGRGTSIGDRVWSRSAKFRIRLGPMPLEDYERLLPGTPAMKRLTAIVRNYVGDVLDWDLNLVLRGDQVPPAVLDGGTRLGQTSWIGTRDPAQDADDLHLAPQTATAAGPQGMGLS